MLLIGIDCATKPENVGLAMGRLVGEDVCLEAVLAGHKQMDLVAAIGEWLVQGEPALLAFDAPLGWPAPMGALLFEHRAGVPLDISPDQLFQRETDRVVRRITRKRPLDVGADRIARTALAALSLMEGLRREFQLSIPMAWTPGLLEETAAIEVYPAATMLSRGWSTAGYKAKDASDKRRRIVESMLSEMVIGDVLWEPMIQTDHPLDAALCVLAAADFVRGQVVTPDEDSDETLLHREGWIWFAPPEISR